MWEQHYSTKLLESHPKERVVRKKRLHNKLGVIITISTLYFLLIASGFGYAILASEITSDMNWLLRLLLILTHLLPFIILSVTIWVVVHRAEHLIQRGIHSLFSIQLGLTFLMVSLAFEFGWHIQQGWTYQNGFSILNYLFYTFMVAAFTLLANGLAQHRVVDALLILGLTTTAILYPVGADFSNTLFKIPLQMMLMLLNFLVAYRAIKVLRDWRFIFYPIFSVGVNLGFIFLLNLHESDALLNPLFHSLHDLAGTEIALVIFAYLIYVNPDQHQPLVSNLRVPLVTQQPYPRPVLPGKLAVEKFTVVIQSAQLLRAALYLPSIQVQVPIVLFLGGEAIHDGAKRGDRYSWLGRTLASHGFAVMFLLSTPNDMQQQPVQAMLERLKQKDLASRINREQIILGGHAKGGLIVSCLLDSKACCLPHAQITRPSGLVGAFTLESCWSTPDIAVNVGNLPMMLVAGSEDGCCPSVKIAQHFDHLMGDGPFYLVTLAGINHSQMANSLDLASDPYELDHPAKVDHEIALARISNAILSFLQSVIYQSLSPMKKLSTEVGCRVQLRTPCSDSTPASC